MTAGRIAGVLCAALLITSVPLGGAPAWGGVHRAAPSSEERVDHPSGEGVPASADAPAQGGDGPGNRWRDLITRAVTAGRERSFRGETVWLTQTPGGPKSWVVEVRGGAGRLHVGSAERLTLRLGDLGGDVVHHEQGWFSPLPAVDREDLDGALDALAAKYRVESGGDDRVLDRPSSRLDIYRRSDDRLAERFWLDATTGLLLRRETFDASGGRLRLAGYRVLDLSPAGQPRRDPSSRAATSLERRAHEVRPVGDRRLAALEKAGYVIPGELPGEYERVGVYASVSPGGGPLQAVYRDGLYSVSVFQQRGRPDWSSLPDGLERATDVDWPAYEWPGAVPHRLLWEASGTTFLVIGDAPPDDLAALAGALPRPASQRPLHRLRRGLGRIWSAMSPWE